MSATLTAGSWSGTSKSSSAMRIAILATDHVRSEFQPEFGDYPDMFQALLGKAGEQLGVSLKFTTHDVTEGEIPGSVDADAYLITGSKHSVYDDLPWIADLVAFLGEVLQQRRKIIGICFGHQLMAHFFGGRVGPAEQGWGVGLHESQVNELAPWYEGPSSAVKLLCSHKDQVLELPDGARTWSSSEFCPLGGFVISDQVWTTQGHPEFRHGYSEALMRLRRGDVIPEDVVDAGLASLVDAADDELVARWIVEFASAKKNT